MLCRDTPDVQNSRKKKPGDKGHGNMADHMEQDEANTADSLPGIGELKTFSQVISDEVSLRSRIEFTDPCKSPGSRTTEIRF